MIPPPRHCRSLLLWLIGIVLLAPASAGAQPPADPGKLPALDDAKLMEDLDRSLRSSRWMATEGVAAALLDIGHFRLAIAEYEAALSYAREASPAEALEVAIRAQLAIGRARLGLDELPAAREAFEKVAPLLDQQGAGPHDERRLNALLGLAQLTLDEGDAQRAEELYRQASEQIRAAGSALPAGAAVPPLLGLAACRLRRGDYRGARQLLDRTAGEHVPAYEPYVLRLGAMADMGDRQWAGATAKLARLKTLMTGQVGERLRAFVSEQLNLASTERLSVDTDLVLSLAFAAGAEEPAALSLALETVLQRKGLVLDVVAARRELLRQVQSPKLEEILAREAEVQAELGALARQIPSAERHQRSAELSERLQALQHRVGLRMELDLDRDPARAGAFMKPTVLEERVTIRQVQQALGAGALVEIVRFRPIRLAAPGGRTAWQPPRYAALLLLATGQPQLVDLGAAASLDRQVQQLRGALSDPRRPDAAELGRRLDRLLTAKIRPHLTDGQTVWLAPDGLLHLLPFEALVDEHRRYLVQRYDHRYLTSGRDLVRLRAADQAQGPDPRPSGSSPGSGGAVVIIANPSFARAPLPPAQADRGQPPPAQPGSLLDFPPLPGTAAEAATIAALFRDPLVLTEERASKAALLQAESPRILHIATHGYFLPELGAPGGEGPSRGLKLAPGAGGSPPAAGALPPLLLSGLALAGAAGAQGEGGVITAGEMAALSLDGTELVVLSACDTGIGALQDGEGVMGLRRALIIAGARSQVLSLWKVSDLATCDLMAAFYRRLIAGQDRYQAMRAVRLGLLSEPATSHPFFWASFVVSGAAGPVTDLPVKEPAEKPAGAVSKPAHGCGCRLLPHSRGPAAPICCAVLGVGLALARRRKAHRQTGSASAAHGQRWLKETGKRSSR